MKQLLAAIATLLFATAPAAATEHIVRPGEPWSELGPKLRPGDRILLAPGSHIPAAFERVAGTPEQPIVIRPVEDGKLVEIEPKREALKLTDCSHIRIERLSVKDARRAGILIESTRPGASRDIAVSDVLVAGVAGLAEQSGIVVRGAREVGIRRSRIENCIGAAVLIEHAESVAVEDCQLFARSGKPMQRGVGIEGSSADVSVRRVFMRGPIETGVSVGVENPPFAVEADEQRPAPAKPERPEALARRIDILETRTKDVIRPLRIGSCAALVVRQCTMIDPREEVYEVAAAPGGFAPAEARILDNLVVWEPGSLRRLCHAEPGARTEGVVLGSNLWWSKELPTALPLLGPPENPFLGKIESPQVLDRDPLLDDKGYPTEPGSMVYGAPRP